jgi:hypothetical protein
LRLVEVGRDAAESIDLIGIHRHDGDRHTEVRVGNVDDPGGGRQIFGAVANPDELLIKVPLVTGRGRRRRSRLAKFCPLHQRRFGGPVSARQDAEGIEIIDT